MIDVDKLEQYAQKVFDRLNYFNDYTLQLIGERIKTIGKLSAHDQQALKNMADISGDMRAITKKLSEITKLNTKDIEKIYTQTITDSVNSYKPLYDFRGMKFIPFENNTFAQQLVKHWYTETVGNMVNLSRTKALCFDRYNLVGRMIGTTSLEGAFQKAMDDAVVAISTGTTDFNTAMRETVRRLGGSGVKVNYGNNVTRRLDSMVRQNLLYGAKRSALAYDEHIGEKLNCDGFEVDYHPFPRPSHEFMGGEMFSYKGDVTIDGITYPDGEKALQALDDYNCLHFKLNLILGISQPRYDKKWLDEQKARDRELIEYNGIKKTGYGWKQTQRRLEREIRKESAIRDMAKASGDKTLVRDCDAKIKLYRDKYDDMCEKTGMQPTLERMATHSGKVLTDGGGGGIIREQESSPRKPSKGDYSVDWSKVQHKEYKERFLSISKDEKVVSSIDTRAKWALNNRNQLNTEELYAISLKDGREIGRITDQSNAFGVIRTPEFTKKLNNADSSGDNILLIHNHPRGLPPSIGDINALLKNKSISGITVGHDGSVYYYTRPEKEIPYIDYAVKIRHYKSFDEVTNIEKALESLQGQFGFILKKL